MNFKFFKWLAVFFVAICTAASSFADPLQFTNLTTKLFPNLTEQLNAVTYGGSSNFVAVGNHQVYVIGNFTLLQPWFTPGNWVTNKITSNSSRTGSNLVAVTSSGKLFLATGDNNWVYVATNNFSGAGLNWPSNNSKAFGNGVLASGAAFNSTNFVVVGEAPDIGYTNSPIGATNWPLGVLTNRDFVESFRGVTAYGTNGFAACGVFGDVRLSVNSGLLWQQLFGQIAQPDFYGIASDGTNTFVCVGATNSTTATEGIILTSTNRGSTWRETFTNDLATLKSPINSVAYTGSGFVAVGNNGQVITSPDGLNWAVVGLPNIPIANTNSAANVNFNGVAFATSGYMHDVGEIVGSDGNVIITAPPPPTNNSFGNEWINVGVTTVVSVGVTNTLPANTLQVTNIWGTNIVTVDWYTGQWPNSTLAVNYLGNPATNSFTFTPPFITDNTDNHTNYYWAQARDLRTGFVNTNRTLMVLTNFMRPTATLLDTNVICNGDSTIIHASLTGNGPWTVYWTDGFTNFTNSVGAGGVFYANAPFVTSITLPNAAFNPTNVFLNQATNHTYQVWKLSDAFFPADDPQNLNPTGANPSGDLNGVDQVTVNPRPTAAVVTTNTICNGSQAILQANLTGIGPWTVYWTDGFTNYAQTVNVSGGGPYTDFLTIPNGTFNPTNVFPNAPSNHIYSVYAVSDSNCSANAGDISGIGSITVNPRPTASLVTAQTICNGQSSLVQLEANLTGLGPWTVTWSDGYVQTTNATPGSGATVVRGVQSLEVTNVFLNNPTNYIFTVASVSNADTCLGNEPGDLTCTNTITVNPRPTASSVTTQTICNGQSTSVQLAATLTGLGPWTVTWSDGYVQTTNGPVGSGAQVVRGVQDLEVTNIFLNNATNYVFTVSSVTNADSCLGNQPGDLTCTNTITVNPRPTASSVTTQTICNGQSTSVQLAATLTGLGPWTVTWSDGYVQTTNGPVGSGAQVVRGVQDLEVTNIFLNNATNYVFTVSSVTNADSCLGNQPGDLTCTNTITVNPRPTASSVTTQTICNGQSTSVQLAATLTGLGPWTVTWSDGYVQTTNGPVGSGAQVVRGVQDLEVTNIFLNNATNYVFTVSSVTNADSCLGNQPGDLTCTNTITVNPRPTAYLVSTETVCNGNSPVLQADLTGLGPWTVTWSDGFVQITNAPVGSGAVLLRAVSPSEATNIFPNVATNYIFSVSSVTNADSCLGNQPGDLTCTNTVVVNPRPTASSVTAQTICNGQSASVQLAATLTGLGPWTVTWSDGFVQTTNGSPGFPAQVVRGVTAQEVTNIFLNSPTNYSFTVTSVTNSDTCFGQPGDLTCTNTITVNPLPQASLVTTQSVCNGNIPILQANLTGVGPWTVTWSDGFVQTTNAPVGSGVTILRTVPVLEVTNIFPNNPTNYVFTVTSVTNADSCIGNLPQDLTCTNVVIVNPRPTASQGIVAETICNGQPALAQAVLTGIGPWTVTWSDGFVQTTNATLGNGAVAIRTVSAAVVTNVFLNFTTNYLITVTSVTNSDTCGGNQPGDLTCTNNITVNPRATSTLVSLSATNCNEVTISSVLTNVLTGIGPWTVTWSLDGQAFVQSGIGAGPGPFTNTYIVFPTNTMANAVSNNIYFVSNVVDTNSCNPNPGDIIGTNLIAVLPLSSIPTNGFGLGTNDFSVLEDKVGTPKSNPNFANLGKKFVDSFGNIFLTMNFSTTYRSNFLYITNHLVITGASPTTPAAVTLMEVGADINEANTVTNFYTKTFTNSNPSFVVTNVIFNNTFGTNFTLSVYSLNNSNCSDILTTSNFTFFVNATPSVDIGIVGSDNDPLTVCSATAGETNTTTLEVDLQGGKGTWQIWWDDGLVQTTNGPSIFRVVTNAVNIDTSIPVVTTYWVTNLVATNLSSQLTTNTLDINAGFAQIIVDPILDMSPTNLGNVTSCYDVAAPLSVGVPAGYTVDWFQTDMVTMVATGTLSYVPSVPIVAGGNTTVTNTYYVSARFVDTNLTQACSSPLTNVFLISVPCTNTISSIVPSGTNVLIGWSGNYQLQSTTNLLPPVIWLNIYTGVVGPNTWTNSAVAPPADMFFRLYAPTN